MDPRKTDSYQSSGVNSGTSFSLSDHDIVVPSGVEPDSIAGEFQKLPDAAGLAAEVRVLPIERPPFVTADGAINGMSLRLFLVDTSNRVSDKLAIGVAKTNLLSDAAVLSIIPWVTGIARRDGQSIGEYFEVADAEDSIYSLIERVKAADEATADTFVAALTQTLSKLGQGAKETSIEGFEIDLVDLIHRDPKNLCRMMIDIISPQESTGTQSLGGALLSFREICMRAR